MLLARRGPGDGSGGSDPRWTGSLDRLRCCGSSYLICSDDLLKTSVDVFLCTHAAVLGGRRLLDI